ncbi:hypothetical protein [Flaviaesturariibacter amylovorans]|uniref:Plug domain-containing protein n=1 Tax=Flaviaesturariibacter amylovorans TaxID=1084520 RepID=A0ABP8HSI8_9BACT
MLLRFLLSLLLLSCAPAAFSQGLDSLLAFRQRADPQERVHVHFDKSQYNPGETIWFKAYLYAGGFPSGVSSSFYAELLDEDGRVLQRHSSPVAFAAATGSFTIDSNFVKPAVFFKAYTVSMLNSDTGFLYTKAIPVLGVRKTTLKPAAPALRLLPEGGDLIVGLPGTVAFKATDERGAPLRVGGTVTDDKGKSVAELRTIHDGMGRFTFIPEEGRTYTVSWKDGRGKPYSSKLPPARPQGTLLAITDHETGKRFTLLRTADVPEAQKELQVVAFMNQEVLFKADINMTSRVTASGVFPTGNLRSGILCITVFDRNRQPLLERISFVNNRDFEFDGDVYLTQKNFNKRGLNKLEISVSDTVPTNLSLSVTDADLNAPGPMEDNIVSRLLLTSELRGSINNPYYYVFSNSDSAAYHTDLLMLTHGWRRYNWSDVWARRLPPRRYTEHSFLAITGGLVGVPPGLLGPGLQVNGILQTADTTKDIIVLPVDRKGNIFSEGLVFYGPARLYFSLSNKSLPSDAGVLRLDNGLYKPGIRSLLDSSVLVGIAAPDVATIAANQKVTALSQQSAQQFARSVQLANVTVAGKAQSPLAKMDQKYARGMFAGGGKGFDLVNDPMGTSYANVFQFLQGKVAGLQISNSGPNPTLTWRGGSPALYLDEMQSDVAQVGSISVHDIAYVKVFRPGESIMTGGGGGVIAIYTRKGGEGATDPSFKGMSFVTIQGYSPVKEFFSPDYAKPSERDAYGDYRSTLLWSPTIYTDKTRRKIRLQFYNNDVTKHFRLVLEGVNAEGKVIRVEKKVRAVN